MPAGITKLFLSDLDWNLYTKKEKTLNREVYTTALQKFMMLILGLFFSLRILFNKLLKLSLMIMLLYFWANFAL